MGAEGHRIVVDWAGGGAQRPVAAVHAPKQGTRDVVIAVDAGHGGKDPGAIGHRGTLEKGVVLEIARELAGLIDREPGMRAVLIRDGDYYIAHRERIRRARAAKADMFVSIHADAIRDRAPIPAGLSMATICPTLKRGRFTASSFPRQKAIMPETLPQIGTTPAWSTTYRASAYSQTRIQVFHHRGMEE